METKVEFKFDSNAVLMFLYLMYKCHMLTNNNIKHMMKVIKEAKDVDIVKALATAEAKADVR